ncbi:phosphotransferase [Undibacterium sp. TS12]|uniref:phosphotransferase n=1 Tax=Undibacterium sp. TS12 TaxID=2908202 RepID=UPI001F4CC6FA|nr:phosphotransferase [Undibacterium sp. TS12]MCH8617562.1 aminoglycoside phosphotransferase family protein [Undibacterium sp. TS12]
MFLTPSNMAHYLLARGTLTPATVVNGDFMVVEAGRRNRNFKIIHRNGSGLFIKQIKDMEAMSISTMQREAACYRMALQEGYHGLAQLMPRMIDHDADRHCLTIDLLPSGENLTEFHQRRHSFPVEIGKMLGVSLGTYHQTLRGKPLRAEDLANFPRTAPWILSFHQTSLMGGNTLSGGVQQLGAIIRQYPDLQNNLMRLARQWQYDSIIHGDMKWDNCVVYPDAEGKLNLRIIDWELVDYGDASWDIGAILQAYLTAWIFSMPLVQENSPEKYVSKAAYQLETMQPAIHAFWRSYTETAGIGKAQANAYLLRCIEYGAARMVQTAFEILYYSNTMTAHAATLLQVSQNILLNPRQAATALYGFPQELSS